MIRIFSQKELLETFRPLERAEVEVPLAFKFPLVIKDYLSWSDPSGHRVYLVFSEKTGKPGFGIVFKNNSSSESPVSMCEWCHSVRAGNQVGLMTATASANRKVGIYLCQDLSCKSKILESPGADDFQKFELPSERIKKLILRMSSFARQNLF